MPDYKSFISVPCLVRGRAAFRLFIFSPSGERSEFGVFLSYCLWLAVGGRRNGTFKRYTLAVARWLDYMYVGMQIFGNKVSTYSLYLSYADYLANGKLSDDPIVIRMVNILGENLVVRNSRVVTHAGIDSFILFCEEEYVKRTDYIANGLITSSGAESELIRDLAVIAQRARFRNKPASKRRMYGHRSNKISEHVVGAKNGKLTPISPGKYFPLGHIAEFIGNLRSYRDAALMSLCAASSWRVSEAMQILWEDIDFATRKIHCREPNDRHNYLDAYIGLSFHECEQLAWKGRETSETVLLEPYGTLFFKYLALYRQDQTSSQHNFVFETDNGRPLFLSSYSGVVLDAFKLAAAPIYEKLGFSLHRVGPHSLRHSYCYFMYNFIQFEEGMGMSLHNLAKLTGHKDVSALAIYAQRDRERFYEEIYIATQSRINGGDVTENQLRVEYLRNRLEEVTKALNAEKEVA